MGFDVKSLRNPNSVIAPPVKIKVQTRPLTPLKTQNPDDLVKKSYMMEGFLSPIELSGEDLQPPTRIRGDNKTELAIKKIEEAISIIYKYYSRQRIKNNIQFDNVEQALTIDKGEINAFLRDFNMTLPKSTVMVAYKNIRTME